MGMPFGFPTTDYSALPASDGSIVLLFRRKPIALLLRQRDVESYARQHHLAMRKVEKRGVKATGYVEETDGTTPTEE